MPRAPSGVGPHEGRELALMTAGIKPLAIFTEEDGAGRIPEDTFDVLVEQGRLVKHVALSEFVDRFGSNVQMRHVLYALPQEQWRIPAMLMIQNIYDSLLPGWRPDLERAIGSLLGYERADVEAFLRHIGAERPGPSAAD